MSIKVASNRLIVSSLNRYAEFYQRLLRGVSSFQELGNRLVCDAETAQAFRQVGKLEELGLLLLNHPIEEYRLIGQYYQGWSTYMSGDNAQHIFERVVEQSTTYKAKALIALAAVEARKGNYEAELGFFSQAMKHAKNPTTMIDILRATAVVKSKEGFRKQALKDLETVEPLISHAAPKVYYDFLNSYAVELGEAGRKDEARNIIKHVLASPFAFAYPEWQETANELKESNRSFVAVPQIVPKHVETPKPVIKPKRPASVLTFPKLKEAPLPEKPERLSAREFGRMTARQKKELFMTAFRTDAIRESEYYSLASMCGLLEIDPADRIIDLEDMATLEDIIAVWCNMIEPDQFATVMSALRDCSDDWRQHNIIDSMITIAFQQTRSHSESEQEWRSKVEARLPEK